MQIDVIEATWGRVLRVSWAWAWRWAVTAIVLRLAFDVARDTPLAGAFKSVSHEVGGPWVDKALMFVTLAILAALPFRLILGKDFGDFRLALVREPRDADAFVFTRSRWSRGLGPALGAAIIGAAAAREWWRRAPQDLLLIVGVLAGIATTTLAARRLFLPRPAARAAGQIGLRSQYPARDVPSSKL